MNKIYEEKVANIQRMGIFISKGNENKILKICLVFAKRNVDNMELIHC